MNSTRANWLRNISTGLVIFLASAGASNVWAQNFGPDPFRPYNSQYDPYTYPTGPSVPGAGQGGIPASGVRGANQFQNYLNELTGADRQGAEKYGIGLPYFRSAVDPRFDLKGNREYRPNKRTDRTFEQTQDLVTQKYFAFLTEKDPRKRTELLREYNVTRGRVSRALSARREDSTRILEAATRPRAGVRPPANADRADDALPPPLERRPRPSSVDRSTSSLLPSNPYDSARPGSSRSIPPAPALIPRESSRASSSVRRSPSDILNRARRLNSANGATPTPGTRSGTGTSSTTSRPDSDN
jgi:hypothetical protein